MLTHQTSLFSIIEEETPLDDSILYSRTANDSAIISFIENWLQAPYFALDIETYGREDEDGLRPWKGNIRLIQIGLPDQAVGIFDLGGHGDNWNEILHRLEKLGFLSALKKTIGNDKQATIGHNLKFDLGWLYEKFGIKGRNLRDTDAMSRVYWAGIKRYNHSLKDVAYRILGEKVDKTEQKSDWGWPLTKSQLNYAAKDALLPIKVFMALGGVIKESSCLLQAQIENNVIPAFVQMEAHGFPVDLELLEDAIAQWQKASDILSKPFVEQFPDIPLTASSAVLIQAFARIGVYLDSTADDILQGYIDVPAVKSLTMFRSIKKSIDYMLAMRINYRAGYCRGQYRQQAPKGFGRSTCGKGDEEGTTSLKDAEDGINLQNCPKHPQDKEILELNLPKVRSLFRPAKGRALLISDLSQAHSRIACEASQDPALLAVYNEGRDMHCITASPLARTKGYNWTDLDIDNIRKDKSNPACDVAEKLRSIAKNVFYGSLNSQGKNALVRSTAKGGVTLLEEEAEEAIKAWRSAYRKLYNFQFSIVQTANSHDIKFLGVDNLVYGKVTGLSGRHIYMPKFEGFNGKMSVNMPDACAFYWTSTEADAMKIAMANIQDAFDANPHWEAHICNLCHDEIDAECNEKYALEVATVLQNAMDKGMERFIKTIPVNEKGATPANCIVNSYADK